MEDKRYKELEMLLATVHTRVTREWNTTQGTAQIECERDLAKAREIIRNARLLPYMVLINNVNTTMSSKEQRRLAEALLERDDSPPK